MLDGENDEGWDVVDAEFSHEPAAVGFDAFGRKKKNIRDLGACFALDDELEYFSFTLAQAVERTFQACMTLHVFR